MKSHVTEDVLTHVRGNVYHLAPMPIGWRVLSEEEQQNFHDDLVAVADLWLDARWCVAADQPGVALVWENAPILV